MALRATVDAAEPTHRATPSPGAADRAAAVSVTSGATAGRACDSAPGAGRAAPARATAAGRA